LQGKFWSRINFFGRSKSCRVLSDIHPVELFHKVILKERERSDRTGLPVSLFVFEEIRSNEKNGSLRDLVELLNVRVRSTDEIGWYDDDRVGVILPHTGLESAEKFSQNFQELLTRKDFSFKHDIYIYPTPFSNNFYHASDGRFLSPRVTKNDEQQSLFENSMNSIHPCFPGLPFWKRVLDVLGAVAGLIILSPLLFTIAIFIKIVSPGPALFRQVRIGYRGEHFTLFKFRTMHCDAESSCHERYLEDLINTGKRMTKLDDRDDERIIAFGKILRKTFVDELPQLLNVLRGEMSLVGPRPCLPYEAERFLHWQTKRFDAMPGLTGLWQVNGKNKTTFNEMIRLDIEYARKKSLWLDLSIILKTIPAVIGETATAL
jgi:lipopolysaccharide/colanic/teichoic acid biosynthesis glycosyltransferase